jgi:hypothetical protein
MVVERIMSFHFGYRFEICKRVFESCLVMCVIERLCTKTKPVKPRERERRETRWCQLHLLHTFI